MPGFAFAVPVVSGKEELDRKTLEEIAGPRLAEHEAAIRDAGHQPSCCLASADA